MCTEKFNETHCVIEKNFLIDYADLFKLEKFSTKIVFNERHLF